MRLESTLSEMASQSNCWPPCNQPSEPQFPHLEAQVKMLSLWGFPGGPVVRTWSFFYCGHVWIPSWGTKIPQAMKCGHKQTKRATPKEIPGRIKGNGLSSSRGASCSTEDPWRGTEASSPQAASELGSTPSRPR